MSFNHLPSQITVLILGWAFTLYLQHRANVRSEATRRKDKLIDRIDKLADWAEKKLLDKEYDPVFTEEIYSALISQIEIRINQLNSIMGSHKTPTDLVAELRFVDIQDKAESAENIKRIRNCSVDLSENLELACNTRYFENNDLKSKLNNRIYELRGILTGSLALFILSLTYLVAQQLLT